MTFSVGKSSYGSNQSRPTVVDDALSFASGWKLNTTPVNLARVAKVGRAVPCPPLSFGKKSNHFAHPRAAGRGLPALPTRICASPNFGLHKKSRTAPLGAIRLCKKKLLGQILLGVGGHLNLRRADLIDFNRRHQDACPWNCR